MAIGSSPLPIYAGAQRWGGPLLVLVLITWTYWPGLTGGFAFDDFPNIVDNARLRVTFQSSAMQWLAAMFSSPASDLQRPLAMLSFALNHALTGLDPFWMKATNLGIHLVNTGLVFALSRQLLAALSKCQAPTATRDRIALWVAAAWALNPINLMAVLFVVQRMESLCHLFVFAGLWLYLHGRARLMETGRGWVELLAGLVGCTALGALCKESAVLLPLYALLLEWVLPDNVGGAALGNRRMASMFGLLLVMPAAVGLAWLMPRVLANDAYGSRDFTLVQRLLTESRVIVDYIHWTVLPNVSQLSLYHDDYLLSHGLLDPPSTLVSILAIAGLIGATIWLRRKRPLASLGIAWFLSAHLLTATVIPLELVYEHRNYFASFGLCLLVADVLLCMPEIAATRRAGVCAALGLLMFYVMGTTIRAREWQDPLHFSMTESAKHPQSPRATYDLARNLVILTGYRRESPFVGPAFAALNRAMQAKGSTTLPEAGAIFLAAHTGLPQQSEWWLGLQQKLRTQPIGPQQTSSLAALVDCEMKDGCLLAQQDMVDSFLAALSRGPNPEVLNIYGNYALNVLHDPTLALRLWRMAADLAPKVTEYQATMARMLIASGKPEDAARYIAQVRRLGPFGQNEGLALELEDLATKARSSAQSPGGAKLNQ